MAVILRLTFPAGRYHANPWGRHVNEGVAEWPPSPWRLLRALIAVWRRTCPDLPTNDVRRLLGQLVEPPLFHLPVHRVAHTRHYMPWEKKGPQDRTLVLDTFVSLQRDDELLLGWPNANLDGPGQKSLRLLLSNLSFLGRAEGWVEADLLPEDDASGRSWNCSPAGDSELSPTPVFCPDPASCFDEEHYPTLDPAKLAKGKINPADFLFDCPRWHLCLDTETVHGQRWSSMPGARWINYTRPAEISHRPRPRAHGDRIKTQTVAQLLLDGPVLPLMTDTLPVGEAARRAIMSCFGSWCRRNSVQATTYRRANADDDYSSPTFSGRDTYGNRLAGPSHTHYWPTPSELDPRRIGGMTLFARDGFGSAEVAALAALRRLTIGDLELRAQLTGAGQIRDLAYTFTGPSDLWQSVTPFLGNSDIGMRGRSRFIRKGLRREWRRLAEQVPAFRGIELMEVNELSTEDIRRAGLPQPYEFCRARSKHGGRQAYRPAAMFRIRLSRPVHEPVSLGYASHFGMGRFEPVQHV